MGNNTGENSGPCLRSALKRFASMLIEEAKDLTGLTLSQLDVKLADPLLRGEDDHYHHSEGQADRYLHSKKDRGPRAKSIQGLENRVAKLLGRTAHTVLVRNNFKIHYGDIRFLEEIEGKPADVPNSRLRKFGPIAFELVYEDNWPTYHQLTMKHDFFSPYPKICIRDLLERGAYNEWPPLLRDFSFQWPALWEKDLPWLKRELFRAKQNTPLEVLLRVVTAAIKQGNRLNAVRPILSTMEDGRKLLSELDDAISHRRPASELNLIADRVIAAGMAAKEKYQTAPSLFKDDYAEYCVGREIIFPTRIANKPAARLEENRCPIHGKFMRRISESEDDPNFDTVKCSHKDCDIRGTFNPDSMKITLWPEFSDVLDPALPEVQRLDGRTLEEQVAALRNKPTSSGKAMSFITIAKKLSISESHARILFRRWNDAHDGTSCASPANGN